MLLSSATAVPVATGRRRTVRPLALASTSAHVPEAADCPTSSIICGRRTALSLVLGGASIIALPQAAGAGAYGQGAKIFGAPTNTSGFMPYAGDGFALLMPSKWNVSKQRDFPNIALKYEDNFDPVNALTVVIQPTDKKSIEEFGDPKAFEPMILPFLGRQTWQGATESEGGFPPGRVAVANLLTAEKRNHNGKTHYDFDIVTRTADGALGGRHHVISAAVDKGRLYILAQQAGEKRWIRGVDKIVQTVNDSFTVA